MNDWPIWRPSMRITAEQLRIRDQCMVEMRDEGMTCPQIAAIFNLALHTIQQRFGSLRQSCYAPDVPLSRPLNRKTHHACGISKTAWQICYETRCRHRLTCEAHCA